MSESSVGDARIKVLHWSDYRPVYKCMACGKKLDPCHHVTDEVILYNNPPEDFIQCMPPSAQQELDLEEPTNPDSP